MTEAMQKWAAEAPPAYVPPHFNVSSHLAAFQVPAKDYLSTRPQFDGLATGALVFRAASLSPSSSCIPKMLIVQRAAHDSMPSCWEVPGGACDPEDATVLHGVARELWEEAGLVATAMVEHVGGENVFFTRRGRRMAKYSFLAEVEGNPEVKLDPNEHQAFLWITEEEARARKCGDVELKFTTTDQENVIFEAFKIITEKVAGKDKELATS